MPRKRRKKVSVESNDDIPEDTARGQDRLQINKQFAEEYEASKRRQLLSNASAVLQQQASDESSSSSEEEDELGELLTKGIDKQFREALEAIRSKDPRIYDKNEKFFDSQNESEEDNDNSQKSYNSDDEPVAGWDSIAEAAKSAVRKLTLKDYVRENLLKDGRLSDDEAEEERDGFEDMREKSTSANVASDERPQRNSQNKQTGQCRPELLKIDSEEHEQEEEEEEEEEDFFKKKEKTTAEIKEEEKEFDNFLHKQSIKRAQQTGDELLLHSYLEKENPDEKERFLRDFVLNNGWLDRNAADAPGANDYKIEIDLPDAEEDEIDKDERFDEKNDEFEAKYNFRFEDPDGSNVASYARNIPDSIRRPDDRRKKAREARRLRKQQEKAAKIEDIKRLKNLKKKEIQARLLAIQEAAGDELDVAGFDLDGDFDPEEFNKQMEKRFGDNYYSREDEHMKGHEELKDSGLRDENVITERSNVSEDVKDEVSRMVDEYYNLNYEDIVGGVPVRFKYKKVTPESFNMTPEEILTKDDKELNSIVSLKYLAPYRSEREVKKTAWRAASILKKKRTTRQTQDSTEPENKIGIGGSQDTERSGFSLKKKRKSGVIKEEVGMMQSEKVHGWDDVTGDVPQQRGDEKLKTDEAEVVSRKPKRKRTKRRRKVSAVAL
eukprot:TRINITY_DN125_c0_g4_i1.p1 TRINITY_DN125_c0_g4~~TRINITY_DN125_c0_g4_i1.p1  ORF type:complete len:664 (-),score=176.48 TRINITY_DN125_c0_g4_i1:1301-3292(-)